MKKIFVFFFLILVLQIQGQLIVKPAFQKLLKYPNIRDFTILSNGSEAYFTVQSPLEEISIIVNIKKKKGIWSEPKILKFSGNFRDIEPFLSPNGLKLYFASNRPISTQTKEPKDFDIWFVERKNINTDWSKPINMGLPINTERNEFYPSVANNNNLYFTSDLSSSKGKDDIFFSRWHNNFYSTPVSLSDSINTTGYEFNSYIAPDESFIIFSGYNRKDGLGSGDLYISYKNQNETWSTSKNLGNDINSKYMDYCPFIDITSSTLYFTSKRSFVNNNSFNSVEDFLNETNKYENGLSRIYKVGIEKIITYKK
ncbi:MAG: hypothetical protein V3V16_11865 [Melioribacteraceae bacterium]